MNSVFEWHPSSDLLASIRFDSKAHIWNLNEKQLHRFAQTDPSSIKSPPKIDLHGAVVLGDKAMKSLAWHPQGIVLATVSEDGVVHIWTTQGKCIKTVDTDISPTSVLKWNEKWSHLLIGGQHKKIGSVTVLDVGAQYSKERFQCDYEQPVSDVAWLNRNTFATCSVYEPLVHIFQLGVTAPIRIFQGHTGAVHEMIWHADSELLACRSNNELIKVWMLSNGASQGRLVDSIYGFSEIRKIQWSPTGPGTVNDGKRPKLALVFDIMVGVMIF